MNKLIACCGLDCEKCDAYIATKNNDDALREKTAKLWAKMNNAPITAEMINCEGCRIDGVKTPYCEYICGIRKCVMKKCFDTCAECKDMSSCQAVEAVLKNAPDAAENLKKEREETNIKIESRCGLLCSECSFRETMDCKVCVNIDKPFWADSCPVKFCCEEKEIGHCGECADFVCPLLHTFAYDMEQSDNGKRIEQCRKWKNELHNTKA